jgi:antitoxin component YwqK of YwqJK toxin-antitoxin module
MHVSLIILFVGLLSVCANAYTLDSFDIEKLKPEVASLFINSNEQSELTHTKINLSELIISKKSGLRLYKSKPFTGEAIAFYPTGIMSTSQYFIKGKRSNTLKKWFENGVLSFEAHYLEGQLHGENKSWWSNGKLRSQNFYIEGKTEGVSTSWYSSGEKFKKMN